MYLRIPTWLLFAFLTIAAFAPAAGRWRGWWFVYYGALLVCWVWMSVVAARKAAREDRKRQRKIARLLRQHRNAQKTHREETDGPAAPGTLAIARRRIIVATDRTDDEYDEIRRSTGGDDVTVMIPDRRKEDRRQRVDGYVVERRRAERRRHDIRSFLLTRGWAEVKPLTSEGEQVAS
jgi:hypothetical protein